MSSYNLSSKGEQVRIGNWLEELKLKEETGIRFYPSPKTKDGSLLTKARCISHTDAIEPKDYISNTRDTLRAPQESSEFRRSTQNASGPRRALLEQKLRHEVEQEFQQNQIDAHTEARKTAYISTAKESFFADSKAASAKPNRVHTNNADYANDNAVTFYSYSLKSGRQITFPTSFVGSTENPFKKSSAFTADIRSEPLTRKTDTNDGPVMLPTLTEYRLLNEFRRRLIVAAKDAIEPDQLRKNAYPSGEAVRSIIDALWSVDTASPAAADVKSVAATLSEKFGLTIELAEERALLSAFGSGADGQIALAGITNLVRRNPGARNIELIEKYYSRLDPEGRGSIDYKTFRPYADSLSSNEDLHNFFAALHVDPAAGSPISIDDFFDFYIDVASEMAEDPVVQTESLEGLLVSTWGDL